MSDLEGLARTLTAAAQAAGLSDLDLANVVRFRVRSGAFPAEADTWFGGPMVVRELARAMALRFDNASMATTALLLDQVHAATTAHRISFSDVLRLHPAHVDPLFDARPMTRADLVSHGVPEGEAATTFRGAHPDPVEAWSSVWTPFVAPYEPWSDDLPTPQVRRGLVRSDVDPADMARIAWRAGLHLRMSAKEGGGARHLKGWSSAPRGFLVFDWLGAGPLAPYEADARVVLVEATDGALEALWSHVQEADVLDLVEPFASATQDRGAWVRDLNRLAMRSGNVPSEWPHLEREARRALGASDPVVVQAGLWAARFLPTPYASELRAAFLPFEQHPDPTTRSLAECLRARER